MSKSIVKFSLKEMCIVKHSILKSIDKKQDELLKTTDKEMIKILTKDILEENRIYDKMARNISIFKKKNNIQ